MIRISQLLSSIARNITPAELQPAGLVFALFETGAKSYVPPFVKGAESTGPAHVYLLYEMRELAQNLVPP